MKKTFSLFLVIAAAWVGASAQIVPGQYYQVLDNSENESFRNFSFAQNGAVVMTTAKETLGGSNNLAVFIKYKTKDKGNGGTVDITFHSKMSNEVYKTFLGLYRKTDDGYLEMGLDYRGGSRPKEIKENSNGYLKLILFSAENYTRLLQLNEKGLVKGFKPETKEEKISDNGKKIIYTFDGKPVESKEFQAYEIVESDKYGKETKRELFTADGKPFENSYGWHSKTSKYNTFGKIELLEYRDAKGDFIVYNKTLFPQTKYTYANNKVSQLERLVNNDTLKGKVTATIQYSYDSFGDNEARKEFYTDGSQKIDSVEVRLKDSLDVWIKQNARFPDSYKPLFFVEASSYFMGLRTTSRGSGFKVYTEFMLNDSTDKPLKFTGTFRFNKDYKVTGIAYKTVKDKADEYTFTKWEWDNYKKWLNTYGKKLTEEELKAFEELAGAKNEGIEISLEELFSGLMSGTSTTITTKGNTTATTKVATDAKVDKKTQKEMKKLAKELKKAFKVK